jgi:branched-subunit amino acid aminotransferase/4-amino-4-deoxychorismate lyase
VRHWWAQAAAQRPDCYLRSTFYDDPDGESHALVALRPPAEPPPAPQRLRTVGWVRPFAHLKHVGTFAQTRHGREARQAGYDDALLVTAASEVAETTIANIGFVREGQVIWPSGPALHGIA